MAAVPSAVQKAHDDAIAKENGTNTDDPARVAGQNPTVDPTKQVVVPIDQTTGGLKPREGADYEQRYRVLKGKYDAEVPLLNARVSELEQGSQQQLADLKRQLAETEQRAADLKTQSERSASDDLINRNAEDLDGGDVVELLKRAYEDIRQLTDQVTELRQSQGAISQREVKSVEQTQTVFEQRVRDQVKGFDVINGDKNFVSWTHVPELALLRDYGVTKTPDETFIELMDSVSMATMDDHVSKAVAVYKRYLQQLGTAEKELILQVSPKDGAADSGRESDDSQSQIMWDAAKNRQFYADATRGLYRGKDEEFARLEADLNRAQAEGRWNYSVR